jgi:hypothetical protein
MVDNEHAAHPSRLDLIIGGSVWRSVLLSACISTVLAGSGGVIFHFEPNHALPTALILLGAVMLFPGIMVSYTFASVFGLVGHDISAIFWTFAPAAWIIYFIYFGWLFDPRRRTAK